MELKGDFLDRFVCVCHQLACLLKSEVLLILYWGDSHVFSEQSSEVAVATV